MKDESKSSVLLFCLFYSIVVVVGLLCLNISLTNLIPINCSVTNIDVDAECQLSLSILLRSRFLPMSTHQMSNFGLCHSIRSILFLLSLSIVHSNRPWFSLYLHCHSLATMSVASALSARKQCLQSMSRRATLHSQCHQSKCIQATSNCIN